MPVDITIYRKNALLFFIKENRKFRVKYIESKSWEEFFEFISQHMTANEEQIEHAKKDFEARLAVEQKHKSKKQ